MRLRIVFIVILSFLFILGALNAKVWKPQNILTQGLTSSKELSFRLEALSLINGDPQEIEEEQYFKKLNRKKYEKKHN